LGSIKTTSERSVCLASSEETTSLRNETMGYSLFVKIQNKKAIG
jgi:hypothetical protein